MCLKLVVWALTWEEAMDRGLRALDDMRLQGVKTTAAYYQEILRNPEFRSGQFNTSFVESHPELTNYSIKRKPEELALAIAAAIAAHAGLYGSTTMRSEERRVGKECVGTGKSSGVDVTYKK